MEYIIGFLSAVGFFYFVSFLQRKYNIFYDISLRPLKPSQSHTHNLIHLSSEPIKDNVKKTQSKMHDAKTNIKVIIMDNQAYWIKDNLFYTADMSIDGNVNKDTTRIVDTMTMNSVQLDKMMFIIDRLREEAFYDRGGSGN